MMSGFALGTFAQIELRLYPKVTFVNTSVLEGRMSQRANRTPVPPFQSKTALLNDFKVT